MTAAPVAGSDGISMRIKLDRTLCDGFGMCAEHAPSTFSVDEWGYASLFPGKDLVARGDEEAIERAIEDCPVGAIMRYVDPGAAGNTA